jgi:long-chain acyl-CoA synthetase
MGLDLALYRRYVRVSTEPSIRLSVIDISPDHPQRTIVLLHGYGGQARQWKYQLEEFSFSNRVIAIDLRGHGRADKPEGKYTMAQIQRDLELTLEELKVDDEFVLIGHSFGGAIATEYAVTHPERVANLILIATAGEFKLNPFYRLLLRLPLAVLRGLTPFVKGWLAAPPPVMHSWYHHNIATWNGWSLFRDLRVPTTVIHGHLDRVFAKPLFEEVARAIPNCEEVNVGASGHLVMLERRDAVNRVIQRCLEQSQRSWRDEPRTIDASSRAALVQERPWLAYYDDGAIYNSNPARPIELAVAFGYEPFPGHTAIILEGKHITYRRFHRDVIRFAMRCVPWE